MTETPLQMLVESVAALVAEVRNLNARVRLVQDTIESELGSQAALALEMFRREQNLRMEATNDPVDDWLKAGGCAAAADSGGRPFLLRNRLEISGSRV
jgi:hypothetical protein